MPDQQIGKVTIKTSSTPSLTTDVGSVKVNVNGQNSQRVGVIQYGGASGSDATAVIANAAFAQANSAYTQANSAFGRANNSFTQANNSFNVANVAFATANSAFTQANNAASFANGAFVTANNSFNVANASFSQANNSFNVANSSFTQANNSFNVANVAYVQANNAASFANGAFVTANNSFNVANSSFTQANNSFNVANAAFTQANTAFDSANNRVLRSGDTMTGLLRFNTTGNTIVGPVYSSAGIDLFTDIPNGFAELNWANTNYVRVNNNLVAGETGNTRFELNESAKHFRVQVPGNTLELSQQDGLVANTNLTVTGEANVEAMLHVGTGSYTLLPDLIAQFTGNSPFYSQVNQQNLDANGSADFVVTADIGTDLSYYTDLGKRGSNNFFGSLISPLDSYLIAQGSDGSRPGSNLFIITTTSGFGDIVFAQGGTGNENETARFIYNNGFIIKRNLQANGIVDGTYNLKDYTSLVYNYANTISYNVSLSYAQANAAFDAANNAGQYAQPAYNQANSAFNVANAAFSQANNSFNVANVTYTTANNAGSFANGAFDRANSSYAFANTGYTQANNAASFANGAFDRANSGYAQANNAASFANGAFTLANTKYSSSGGTISGDVAVTGNLSVSGTVTSVNTQILLVRDNIVTLDSTIPTNVPAPAIDSGIEVNRGLYQNTQLVWSEVAGAWRMSDGNTFASIASANLVQAAFGQSNNAFNVSNAAFSQANNAFNVTNVVFGYANSAYAFANTSYTQANNAASFANSAFTKANNALANTTGTFAGDLTVTGNVSTVANVTANYFVTTGSAGVITGANLIYSNTFIASVGYQFPDGTTQTTAASANISSAAFQQANNAFNVANAAFGQANNSFNVANVAYDQANSASSFANGAFARANSGYDQANSAYAFANTGYTQANNAASFANSAYAFANTGYLQANNAASFANSAYAFANTGYTQANNAASFANGAFARANSSYDQANTGASFANGAFVRANSAYNFANTGYAQANSAASFANGAFEQANSSASFANGSFTRANSAASFANGAFVTANSGFAQANNSFNVANAAFGQANNSFNVANVAYTAANNAGSFANSAYASANVKARVWESDTPPTANNYDLWIDSSNGVSYIYTTSNNTSVWVEYGPIGSPVSPTANISFSDQTMTGVYSNRDVVIYQSGTGNITLSSANTVSGNLLPVSAYVNIGTVQNPWNKIVAANVTTQNVSISGVVRVNNSTFLATDALVSISASANSFTQTPTNDGYMLHITGKNNVPTRTIIDSFGTAAYPLVAGRRARGIPEAPTAVQSGDVLLRLAGNGWGTTGFAPLGSARIDIVASETYTDTARGSQIKFYNIVNGTNTVNEIATFNADSVDFTGTVNPVKGFIYTPRTISGNSTSVVIDFASDSAIRCTVNAAMTISFTNYIAGKVIDLWITNISGTGRTITHGVAALNSTTNSLTHSIPSTSTMRLQYISFDGDLANTYVSVTQG